MSQQTAQQQEVVAGAVLDVRDEREGILARAALEADLHHPDELHVGGIPVVNGELRALRADHLFGRLVQGCRPGHSALGLIGVPALLDLRPEQRREHECRRDLLAGGDALVGSVQGEHEELLAVLFGKNHVKHRQKRPVQPFLSEIDEALLGMPAGHQLHHLVKKPSGGNVFKKRRHLRNGSFRRPLHLESQFCRDAHGTHHADRIFAIALERIADHAQTPGRDVLKAVVIVEDLLARGIVVKRVDREVAPGRVLPHLSEHVVADHASVGILANSVGVERTERRAFDDLLPENHMHEPEAPSDDEGAPLAALDLLGRRIRCNVKVLGPHAKEKVSDSAAHDVGLVAALLQELARSARRETHQIRIDAMLALRNDRRLSALLLLWPLEQPFYCFLDSVKHFSKTLQTKFPGNAELSAGLRNHRNSRLPTPAQGRSA